MRVVRFELMGLKRVNASQYDIHPGAIGPAVCARFFRSWHRAGATMLYYYAGPAGGGADWLLIVFSSEPAGWLETVIG